MSRCDELISYLVTHPGHCDEEGKTLELLGEYFHGLPVGTLRPLLINADARVRQAAAWIASELGIQAQPVLDDVIPLVYDSDVHTRSYAMDVLLVCAVGEKADRFVYLLHGLEDPHPGIRQIAMFLVSNSENSQLEAASRLCEALGRLRELHERGLKSLSVQCPLAGEISTMFEANELLLRRYAAIAARRFVDRAPQFIEDAASNSYEDVSKFAQDTIDELSHTKKQ